MDHAVRAEDRGAQVGAIPWGEVRVTGVQPEDVLGVEEGDTFRVKLFAGPQQGDGDGFADGEGGLGTKAFVADYHGFGVATDVVGVC